MTSMLAMRNYEVMLNTRHFLSRNRYCCNYTKKQIINCAIISLQLLLVQPYRQNGKRNVNLAHSFYDGESNDKLKTAKKSRLHSLTENITMC
jgi:hypothetical protein